MDAAQRALAREVARRRTFAIISHPDAGKTTLTEKLLLYGGAVREAGAVRAQKAARYATSDWLAIEKQRGISVSSSVLQFEHHGARVNRFLHEVEKRFNWNSPIRAIMAELMLRGPQTVGELRTNAGRLTHLDASEHVREILGSR
jgi:hypothetical protein